MNPAHTQIRGHTIHSKPASLGLKFLSGGVDGALIILMILGSVHALHLAPVANEKVILSGLMITLLYWWPQKKIQGATFGQRIWGLLPKPKSTPFYSLQAPVFQTEVRSLRTRLIAFGATAVILSFYPKVVQWSVMSHPDWLESSSITIQATLPPTQGWVSLPFFYTVGSWPEFFLGKPIFYSLPYEVAPPTRFVGHVVAHLRDPDISLSLEGPKTPEPRYSPEDLRSCFKNTRPSLAHWSCLSIRHTALRRSIAEMSENRSIERWSLQWFEVQNPALPPEEAPQGIHLSAESRLGWEDRFILVGADGTHQAMILRRPKTPEGEQALLLLEQALSTLRHFTELNSGIAFINQKLEDVHLVPLLNSSDPEEQALKLAQIQRLLISKITVSPDQFDPYFHLAGTSAMLAQNSKNHRLRVKLALGNLESAHHYAVDVSAGNPKLEQIRALEAQMTELFQ
ncbi:MAG: hypothetical protein ACO3A2_11395 [Bdellovibrionia bacterium]